MLVMITKMVKMANRYTVEARVPEWNLPFGLAPLPSASLVLLTLPVGPPNDTHAATSSLKAAEPITVSIMRCDSDAVCGVSDVPANRIAVPISVPSSTLLRFSRKPKRVLVVKQWHNESTAAALREIAAWLKVHRNLKILV